MFDLKYDELEIWFKAIGYHPSPEQQKLHETLLLPVAGPDGPLPTLVVEGGGEQSGKSRSAAMHVLARWATDPLTWLVGERYEDAKPEYEYIRDDAHHIGILKKASYSETGPWELIYTNGHRVKTLASEDVPKLAREAPDAIVMCEPGRQSYDAFRALYRRAVPRNAWFLVAGTFEGSTGAARWYPDLWRECQSDNTFHGVSLSLPSYANRTLYPVGARDPKFLAACRAIRESNPMEGEEEIAERFLGIPRTPKGLVFSEFRRTIHVKDYADFIEDHEVQVWVDPGYNPSAYAVLFVQVVQGQIRICDEFYLHGLTNEEVITMVVNHPMFHLVSRVVIDVAAKAHAGAQTSSYETWCSSIGYRGIPITGQRVDIMEGVSRTHDKLRLNAITQQPYLVVNPNCRNTIMEFEEGYRLRERRNGSIGSDLPIDKDNHAMKAIAYGIIDNFSYSDIRHPLPSNTRIIHSYDKAFLQRRNAYSGK